MRVQSTISVKVSANDGTVFFQRGDDAPVMMADGFDAVSSDSFSLAATSQPKTLSLGNIAECHGIYLEADGATTLFLNGSSQALVLQPVDTAQGCRFYMEGLISSARLASTVPGAPVQGRYVVWGYSTVQT